SSPQQERYLPPLALAGKRQRPLGLLTVRRISARPRTSRRHGDGCPDYPAKRASPRGGAARTGSRRIDTVAFPSTLMLCTTPAEVRLTAVSRTTRAAVGRYIEPVTSTVALSIWTSVFLQRGSS